MLPILLLQLLPLLLTTVPVQDPPHVETSDHGHGDDFASMFEHRAYDDLMRWKERHPWRVGTEVRKFALRYAEARAKGDPEVNRDWDMKAAFLAEVLADDVHTSWLITMMRFDVETRALFDTVQSALADIAASMPTRKDATDASVIAEVGGLRPPIAPPWCFETCVEEFTRIAEAARKAGHAEAANAIAREARTIAERTHDGEIALWCATFLLRAEQEAGRRIEAEGEIRKLLEAARGVEHLPPGFTDALAEIEKWSGADSGTAVGIESLRADLAERAGKRDEAFALWMSAVRRSEALPAGPQTAEPTLAAIESWLHGPDPRRRAALLATRMGRSRDAWTLARMAASTPGSLTEANEEDRRKELFAAHHLDAMLVLVVDHQDSLAAWCDAEGKRAVSIPAGLEKLRELITELRLRGAGVNDGAKPPSSPFDPSPAHLLSQVLIEPLGVPVRGRIGVCLSPELSEMPLGMLVVGEKFLVEQATIVRLTPGSAAWKVDEPTSEAVTKRLQELAGKDDAVRTVQLEMIEGHGSLGSARMHPWYWAGLELGRP